MTDIAPTPEGRAQFPAGALRGVIAAASTNDARPVLTHVAVWLDLDGAEIGAIAVATDSYRAHWYGPVVLPDRRPDWLIPATLLKQACPSAASKRHDPVTIVVREVDGDLMWAAECSTSGKKQWRTPPGTGSDLWRPAAEIDPAVVGKFPQLSRMVPTPADCNARIGLPCTTVDALTIRGGALDLANRIHARKWVAVSVRLAVPDPADPYLSDGALSVEVTEPATSLTVTAGPYPATVPKGLINDLNFSDDPRVAFTPSFLSEALQHAPSSPAWYLWDDFRLSLFGPDHHVTYSEDYRGDRRAGWALLMPVRV